MFPWGSDAFVKVGLTGALLAELAGDGRLMIGDDGRVRTGDTRPGDELLADSRGARVSFIRYVPIWVRHPDFVMLPAGVAWRTDPADAAALRASYERTVAAAGRGPRIQPIPAHLLPAARPASGIISQRTGRQRERRAAGARGRKAQPKVLSNLRS